MQVERAVDALRRDVEALVRAPEIPLGHANPPNTSGVYMMRHEDLICYVGEAKGGGGLRDRLLRKHLSGDEGHALQRAFEAKFLDRVARRAYIKQSILVRWVEIEDPLRVAAVEKLVIWLFRPAFNKLRERSTT